jgi:hypothetical protein
MLRWLAAWSKVRAHYDGCAQCAKGPGSRCETGAGMFRGYCDLVCAKEAPCI